MEDAQSSPDSQEDFAALEHRLRQELRGSSEHEGARIPPAAHAAIAANLRLRAAWVRRSRVWGGLFRRAAAAALLLGAGVALWWQLQPVSAPATLAVAKPNASADIVDAYLLALQLQQGQRPSLSQDVNGDGRVDNADAEVIARRAVALDPRKS